MLDLGTMAAVALAVQTGSDVPIQEDWGGRGCDRPHTISIVVLLVVLLGALAIGFFVAGLIKRRHVWKPLVTGLFAFGLGLLGTLYGFRSCCRSFDESIFVPVNSALTLEVLCDAGRALGNAIAGLTVSLVGGVLTVVLYLRCNHLSPAIGPGEGAHVNPSSHVEQQK